MIRIELELRRRAFEASVALHTAARVSGLFGHTGCGKTTLLMAIAGLLRPRRGRIEIGGTVLFDSAKGIDLPPEKRRVGVVFQESRLFPHLTVRENLRFGRPSPLVTEPSFDEVVKVLDLGPLLDRRTREISGGQARLVALGRALLSRPRILLLDEPMTGLDAALRRRVMAYLLRVKESFDVRMLYVSHVYSDFLALADEMAILRAGRILAAGSPASLMKEALEDTAAGSVETTLTGRVTEIHGDEAVVDVGGASLVLTFPGRRQGADVYVTVGAQDVLLTVGEPPLTSARNALPGRVAEIREAGSRLLVGVDVGPVIWAEITEASRRNLGLEPGSEVTLLIKSSALRGVVLG